MKPIPIPNNMCFSTRQMRLELIRELFSFLQVLFPTLFVNLAVE